MSWVTPTSGHADHGPHPPRPHSNAEEIQWRGEEGEPASIRVLHWTCVCQFPRYQLASTGGQLIIIREDRPRRAARTVVSYSPPMRYRIGEELWEKILAGLAC